MTRRPLSIMGRAPAGQVTAKIGERLTEAFDEVGDAFAWAVKHRELGEVTEVEGHGKRWRYAEGRGKSAGKWAVK